MSTAMLLVVCNLCLLWTGMVTADATEPVVRMHVHPTHGFAAENIEVRCQITTPSIYDNIYLSVRTDNVKPSGILLMVDNTINQCRINKEKFVHVTVCNSTLIIVHVNHVVVSDSRDTIDYSCSQGDEQVVSSYRILREQPAQYYDSRSSHSSAPSMVSATLAFVFVLLAFTRLTTADVVR